MIGTFFNTFFYNPIYNALVALVAILPGYDVGLAVIALTIMIRLVLLPFSLSSARTQRAMKKLEPQIKALKDKHKNDKEKEALETLALYKEARVNPFSSILVAFIQIPVLLALYWVFTKEPFTAIDTLRIYSFTPEPKMFSLELFGLVSVAGKSIILAILAGFTQYLQAHFALSGTMKPSGSGMQMDFQKILGLQLKFVFPFLIATISYTTSGAVALYFITTNTVGVLQELYMRRALDASDAKRLERVAPQ